EVAEIGSAAGVHYDRPRHDRDATAGEPGLLHHRGDAGNPDLDAPLGRALVRHEREPEAIAGPEFRHDLDSADAAHDPRAGPNIPQLAADRAPRRRAASVVARAGFDHDRGVHALAFHGNPSALLTHERLVVGRGVEVVGRAAVAIGRHRVRVLGARHPAAET